MTHFRFKEKYPRGRRGSPAKGVVREERSQGSNPCFSAKQNGQANSLVRFCFSTLNNRDLNESVKKTTRCVVFSGCPRTFAKHKNISHGLLCKRQEQIPVSPPLVNNTNPNGEAEFVLFFSNEYFGIKVDLNGKKNKLPGV